MRAGTILASRASRWVAVVVVAAGWLAWPRASESRPLEVSMWYWHRPFRIPKEEAEQLRAIGVSRLFVLDGTISSRPGKLALTMPQQWKTKGESPPVHLAFRIDASALERFRREDGESFGKAMQPIVLAELERARRSGVRAQGVQIDMDVPTRLLSSYAKTLRQLRKALPKGAALSVTGLQTWYASGAMRDVASATDFVVPQCYEATIGDRLDALHPISSLDRLSRTIKRADRIGRPYLVGLPTYGHAQVFDERGKFVGMYRDMDARQAMRSGFFEVARAFVADGKGRPAGISSDSTGEEVVDLRATAPDGYGRGHDYHVVYWSPTAEMLRTAVDRIRQARPSHCDGVVLFRYPEPGELGTVPLSAIEAGMKGRVPAPNFELRTDVRSEPWEAIEGGGEAPDRLVKLRVKNSGSGPTSIRPDALEVRFRLDRPGIEAVEASGYDAVQAGFDAGDGRTVPCSLARANVVVLRRYHCAPGETIDPVILRPGPAARAIDGRWSAVAVGKRYAGRLRRVEIAR